MDGNEILDLACRQRALEILVAYLFTEKYVAAGEDQIVAVARSVREMLCDAAAGTCIPNCDSAQSDILSAEVAEQIRRILAPVETAMAHHAASARNAVPRRVG